MKSVNRRRSRRGRPFLTASKAALTAAMVIELTHALRNRKSFASACAAYKITEKEALRLLKKPRQRGMVGEYIGDSLDELIPQAKKHTKTNYAVSLVLDYGISAYRAGLLAGVNATNLGRALRAGWDKRSLKIFRIALLCTKMIEVTGDNLLPENTITEIAAT